MNAMDCRRIKERLTPWADNTLPAGERDEMDRHLAACPPCRYAADAERGARQVLTACAARLRSEPAPPGLRTRCEALARQSGPASGRSSWARTLVPVTIVAILLVFTASTLFSLATRRSDTLLAAQLTADHVKCFKMFDSPDSESIDAGVAVQQLAASYGWNVRVPPSAPNEGLQLVGARRCLYADGSIPHVMYHVNGEHVSLYMLEGVTRAPAEVETLGHRSQIWSHGTTTYVLVSSASTGNLAAIANYMKYVMQDSH
jgi:anti-sigma factor (TIGR02949 family)